MLHNFQMNPFFLLQIYSNDIRYLCVCFIVQHVLQQTPSHPYSCLIENSLQIQVVDYILSLTYSHWSLHVQRLGKCCQGAPKLTFSIVEKQPMHLAENIQGGCFVLSVQKFFWIKLCCLC